MIETLIWLVVSLLIAGLFWWAVTAILAVVPLPEPIKTVVNVLLIVIVCLIGIYALVGVIPGGHLRFLR